MNRQCRFHNRGRTAGPLPLKGAAGPLPLKGLRPLRRLASPMLLSPPRSPQKNEPPIRGSSALPEFVPKTKDSRFGAMLLDEERGRAAVPLPLKGAAGPPAIEGAAPLRPLLRNRAIPTILPKLVLKTKGSRFGAMLLDEERGRAAVPPAIEGADAPYAHCFAIGLSPLFRSSFKKAKGFRFGAMLLDEERV